MPLGIKAKENILRVLSPVMRGVELLYSSDSPIFMFHRVLPEGEPCYDPEMVTCTKLFAAFLDWAGERYQVTGVDDLIQWRGKTKKSGHKTPCAITFDDGWRDFFSHAFPLLRERKMTATVFLPVRFVGTTRRLWQERVWYCVEELRRRNETRPVLKRLISQFPWYPPLPLQEIAFDSVRTFLRSRASEEAEEFADRLEEASGPGAVPPGPAFIDWTQARAMQEAGITFGSHTLRHVALTCLEPKAARQEIEQSREEIGSLLGAPPAGFAYPWGAMDERIRDHVQKAGYTFAVTTATRLVGDSAHPFELPRLPVSSDFLRGQEGRFLPWRANFYIARTALRPSSARTAPRTKLLPQEKLRVAFVIDTIDRSQGGTELQLRTLLRSLDRSYFEPQLYLLYPWADMPPEAFPCPVNLVSAVPGSGPRFPATLLSLVRSFRKHRPHIVQTFFREGTYYGTVAARLARVPIVVISVRNAGYWKTRVDQYVLKAINGLANSWQCNSRAVWQMLRSAEHVPAQRIEILPNAIDLTKFAPPSTDARHSARRELGLPNAAPVFVLLANLRAVKDIGTLLEAASLVRQELESARFLVVGEGELHDQLMARIGEMGLTDVVRLVGSHPEVRPFLAAADVGLLTSRSEGSPNALLEYMATGLPAVVSDIPATRGMVDGVFFQPGNPRDLADKILGLFNDASLRARMAEDYRLRARRYSLEAFTLRAQSYYVSLATGYR